MTTNNSDAIFEKGEGVFTKVSGTMVSLESFSSAKGQRVELRLSPATLTTSDNKAVAKEKYTIQSFVNEGGMGWRSLRDAICVAGGVANILDLVGRDITFDIVTRTVAGKDGQPARDFTDYKVTGVTTAAPVAEVSETAALSLIHGKTPSEVLSLGTALGRHAKTFMVKPALLKAFPNKVSIGPDGRYQVAA